MSVECLQNRPPLVHFMREQGPWMRCGAAVREQDRCGPTPAARRDCRTRDRSPFASQPGWRREGHVHFLPVGLYLTGLEVLRRLLQFFFFSKGICFRACVIKPEFYLFLIPLLFSFGLSAPLSGQKIDYVSW